MAHSTEDTQSSSDEQVSTSERLLPKLSATSRRSGDKQIGESVESMSPIRRNFNSIEGLNPLHYAVVKESRVRRGAEGVGLGVARTASDAARSKPPR